MILKNIEKIYSNRIKEIKNLKNIEKRKAIGSLACDIGPRCKNALSKIFRTSWAYINKCYYEYLGLVPPLEKETRGRKKLITIYPYLKEDINKIIQDKLSVDPHFRSEKQYVKLTIKEIKKQLINTGKYNESSFNNSSLNNIINEMGYNLKKVRKTKPLKKIEETDDIFENVHKRKEEAMNNEKTALISLDTKDKVLIGPFSRKGKNRVQIEAVDHELTNHCLIPFGILDMKKNIPYFFNYTSKPTSLDLVDCIEEFYREQYLNSNINRLAILLDNGPDNSGIRRIWLDKLSRMSSKYNIEIELIYYPPYHSKYNPVERLWARLENVWNGFLLESTEICLNFMNNLTWKGVTSVTKLKEVKYEKGLTLTNKEMKLLENNHIIRTKGIEKWSIIITP